MEEMTAKVHYGGHLGGYVTCSVKENFLYYCKYILLLTFSEYLNIILY